MSCAEISISLLLLMERGGYPGARRLSDLTRSRRIPLSGLWRVGLLLDSGMEAFTLSTSAENSKLWASASRFVLPGEWGPACGAVFLYLSHAVRRANQADVAVKPY